ncbi:MAG: type I restriction endonuclease subunit R [Neisseriaceae bacterium]|nr:type I restriction endonuclease subunit R [Neisseriaceae bacterium]
MMPHTQEKDFETAIEQDLLNSGYFQAAAADFNARLAIDETNFWAFLHDTQQDVLNEFIRLNPNDWQAKILSRLDRVWDKEGILHLLKNGLAVDNVRLTLFFVPPLANSPTNVAKRFAKNRFSVLRQVHFSVQEPHKSVDMAVFVNGLPFATLELKNEWTGQNHQHAICQYRSRDIHHALFKPARCLVHFAVDTQEVYMTTKLSGSQSVFLPFNRGNGHGKGNPLNPNGFKTAYLWQEILQKQSIAEIILHFARLEFDDARKKDLNKATLYFPRYHQLDVVRKLLFDVQQNGVGKRYLIQHSAGSGKSNSITWLAFRLIEVYANDEKPVFDSVIVVTDRKVLDKQINDNIRAFSNVKNIVAHAEYSHNLKNALESGKKIIITTIQKFPFIVDNIANMASKKFAVIIDEAHSSQSGTAHDNMNRAMGSVEESDAQDLIIQTMQSRKMRSNASYFAFTATPKNTTLEKFGEKQNAQNADGKPIFKPFHLYSMKQAVEEGFILDVLQNYTTYQSYYEIQKNIEDNPKFDKKKAQQRLKSFAEKNETSIAAKANVMLSHFISRVVQTKRLKGKAKAMVITQNIEMAIRYYQAICRLLAEKGNPFKALIAFSGEKEVDGISYSESQMNGFDDNKTKEAFDEDDNRILVVANKYLTGFDQPKLCAMYVDKPLDGVLCVQSLSRLNRSCPKYHKTADDLFILDFYNTTKDIQVAFEPFYTQTELAGETDINILHDLQHELDNVGVYELDEMENFVQRLFSGSPMSELDTLIQACAARFNTELNLEQEQKVDFKIKAKQFVKIYNHIACIIAFENVEWEHRYWFLKFLIPKLNVTDDKTVIDDLLKTVELSSYALAVSEKNHKITLSDETGTFQPSNQTMHGTHPDDEEKDTLDNLIQTFNERFAGWGGTPEEQKILLISIKQKITQHKDFKAFLHTQDITLQKAVLAKMTDHVMWEDRMQKQEMYKRYREDKALQQAFIHLMQQAINADYAKSP